MKNSPLTSKIKCVIFNLDELIQSPDVKDVLMSLDLPYSVVSIRPGASIEQLLNTAGLLTFFEKDRIFSSSAQLTDMTSGTGIFFQAVRSMGFESSECAVVDRSHIGIDLAMKKDFWVFGINDGTRRTELENKGLLVFSKFDDLSDVIDLFNEEVDLENKRD
jgi:beta-phosphoglucomutase-like phosphatase (HAD superfamily)